MQGDELDGSVYARVEALSEQGNSLFNQGAYEEASSRFSEAYDLLPEPKFTWEASAWLLAGIGDCLFQQGKYLEACNHLREAQKSGGAIDNPFIWLRIGQCLYESGGRRDTALDALLSAYMLAGKEIFSEADPKYLELLKEHAAIED